MQRLVLIVTLAIALTLPAGLHAADDLVGTLYVDTNGDGTAESVTETDVSAWKTDGGRLDTLESQMAQTASDAELSAHAATGNAHHEPVSATGTGEYFSFNTVDQQFTFDPIDLTVDVSGVLPDANVSDTLTVGAAGSVDDGAIPAGVTRDTEWDTVGEIETATGYDFGNAGNLDTGTVADARIPSTIARDTELADYLPLTGGTLTGPLTSTANITASASAISASILSATTLVQGAVFRPQTALGSFIARLAGTGFGQKFSFQDSSSVEVASISETGQADFNALTLDTALAIAEGGTGATDAAGARGNLGLGSTDNVSFGSIRPSGGVLALDLQSATARVAVYADDGSTVALIDNSGNTTLEGNLDTTGGATITGNATVGDVFIRSLPTADFSVAIGDSTTGDAGGKHIVAIGPNAGSAYIGTESGVFIGQDAGRSATGHDNYFAGRFAGYSTTTGERNLGIGRTALANIAGASNFNTSVGNYSGRFYGAGAGGENQNDGNLTTANDGVFLGNWTRPGVNSSTNEIVIGYDAVGNGSNTATIGNNSITTTVLKGVVVSTTSTLGTMAQLTPRADPPSSPSTGMVYCDSDDGKLYAYDGSTWNALW